jgi:acetyl esterase/lipase
MNRVLRIAVVVPLLAATGASVVGASPGRQHGGRQDSEVIYGHKDGMALTFDVLYPKGDANGAAVLDVVSAGFISWRSSMERSRARANALLESGFTVFSVRHGSGCRYPIPEIVGDVRRAVRYIKRHAAEFGVDPDRLGVAGGSAGGHLALMLATTSDAGDPESDDAVARSGNSVAAAVAYFPPTDLHGATSEDMAVPRRCNEAYGAFDFEATREGEFSPGDHVSPDDPPTLLIHGDQDGVVNIRHSLQMRDALEGAGVTHELIVIPGAGHGFRGEDATRAEVALVAWFETHLAR